VLFIKVNAGFFRSGVVAGVGFGVVSFFDGLTVGSGEVVIRDDSVGVGIIEPTFGSGLEFLVATLVELPRVKRYAIATPEMPTTKTIASIHGSGLRLLPAVSSLTACRY
jgi:hypothetical protein